MKLYVYTESTRITSGLGPHWSYNIVSTDLHLIYLNIKSAIQNSSYGFYINILDSILNFEILKQKKFLKLYMVLR